MDGRLNGWMNGWTVEWMDERMDGWIDEVWMDTGIHIHNEIILIPVLFRMF